MNLLAGLGRFAIEGVGGLGRFVVFSGRAAIAIGRRPFRPHLVIEQLHFFGNRSISIAVLTASFTGMVLALQGYDTLQRFGSESQVGPLVALSLLRELAPVLAGIVISARAGSATAATLGNMRMTEQIDALDVMAIDSRQYLVSTRLVAAMIAVPIITALFSLAGMVAAFLLATQMLGQEAGVFWGGIERSVEWVDISLGLKKSFVFAALIATISCYRGYHATGGATGVGRATTRAVVETTSLILVGDYVLTALLM
ncbi:MAG TPA: MlaE family lipid ABC transporter permease subunit [Kofleriaceae bacterium]|nr:MlaE family lipid ABC transporter permease subunit [Kofleriaceae bacterium]